ncbi:MAG: DUF4127 family protein [Clostridiales bacterium]|nr:DUF4127 family protein [Clostridiales bacterium]
MEEPQENSLFPDEIGQALAGKSFKALKAARAQSRRSLIRTYLSLYGILLLAAGVFFLLSGRSAERHTLPASILLLPLDSRPVNTDLPVQLASIAGMDVTMPTDESLDQFLTPSKPQALFHWLSEQEESHFDLSILHLNELLFGGLLHSREYSQYIDAHSKMQDLFDYLLQKGHSPTNTFVLVYIMPRLLPSQYDADMWAYEKELPELSQLKHRLSLSPGAQDLIMRIRDIEDGIPREIRQRYEAVYTEAYNTCLFLLDWLERGLVDEVVIGLDDSATLGLNVKAYQDLKALAESRRLASAYFLHGADELSPLIIARHCLDLSGDGSDFVLTYLSEGQEHLVFPYETVPLRENFHEKLAYLYQRRLDMDRQNQSMPKYVYLYTDQSDSREDLRDTWNRIRSDGSRPRHAYTGLADIAKTNGAWAPLIESIGPDKIYSYVDAYAGWNTAGNSLGTVMAHLLFLESAENAGESRQRGSNAAHKELQKLRILDDYFYQTKVRPAFIAWTEQEGFPYLSYGGRWMEANEKLQAMMDEALTPWPKLSPSQAPYQRYAAGSLRPNAPTDNARTQSAPAHGASAQGGALAWRFRFPWARSFEIRITPSISQ